MKDLPKDAFRFLLPRSSVSALVAECYPFGRNAAPEIETIDARWAAVMFDNVEFFCPYTVKVRLI